MPRRLRFLVAVVASLFAFMNVGAAAAWLMEDYEKRQRLRLIMDERFGFNCSKAGVWTWQLWQEPLYDQVECVRGSAVNLCLALGIPYIRRAAPPLPNLRRIHRACCAPSAAPSAAVRLLLHHIVVFAFAPEGYLAAHGCGFLA